jgi:hypothetical protein
MTTDWAALGTQFVLPYTFRDASLLRKALRSGDSNSDDREGHRGMAQVGDALMGFVIISEGFARGLSRSIHILSSLFHFPTRLIMVSL